MNDEVEQLKAQYEKLTLSCNQLQSELSSLKTKLVDMNDTPNSTQSYIQPNTTVVSNEQKLPQVDGAQDDVSFNFSSNDDVNTPCRF